MSEKRIIELLELLAEYLRKTDRLMENAERLLERMDKHDVLFKKTHERMDKHDLLFEKQFNRMDLAYQTLVNHSEKIESLQLQTKVIETENKTLLQEILSISKRVQTIEGKP